MAHIPRSLVLLVVATMIDGCVSTARPPFLPSTSAATSQRVRHSQTTKLHGVIDTDVWNIAKGTESIVDGDLAVFASQEIHISGTLLIEHAGLNVSFFAPTIVIDGVVRPAGSTRPSVKTIDVVSACSLTITGTLWSPASDGLALAAPSQNCSWKLKPDARVITSSGRNGSPDNAQPGSIDIGTEAAIHAVKLTSRAYRHKVDAVPPFAISIGQNALVRAGPGGRGISGSAPKQAGPTWLLFDAGAGAKGGSVRVVADRVIAVLHCRCGFFAGRGGDGGQISVDPKLLDGNASSPNTDRVTLVQGDGGQGGDIELHSGKLSNVPFKAGDGGDAGAVGQPSKTYEFRAGNAFGSGSAGFVSLRLANAGAFGSGGHDPADPAPKRGSYHVLTVTGGDGGTPALRATGNGGNGAELAISAPKDVQDFAVGAIVVQSFGDGGIGQSACGSHPAAKGGNGGRLVLWENITPRGLQTVAVNNSFNGGDGGDGATGGEGGLGGYLFSGFEKKNKLGTDGKTGPNC